MKHFESFYNDGFGWVCRRCEERMKKEGGPYAKHSRLLTEGEAEARSPKMSAPLAKWADPARTTLVCPECGVTELIELS